MTFTMSTKINTLSEYVTLKDLRMMFLQIGWVGIPTAPAWLPTDMLIKVLLTVCFIGCFILLL